MAPVQHPAACRGLWQAVAGLVMKYYHLEGRPAASWEVGAAPKARPASRCWRGWRHLVG